MSPTLRAKNKALSNTPSNTPNAKLWVTTTTATVLSITIEELFGWLRKATTDDQLKVPIDTMIITATTAALGICATQSPKKTTSISKNTPAIKVDKRVRPPDLTLITDCPIMAQPAMPPKNPEAMLAVPWPTHSRFLLLGVSVKSSRIVAVIIDSSRPTAAMVME